MRRFLLLVLGVGLLLPPAGAARAQAGARVDLYPPDASKFPAISTLVDVFDDRGVFASGLSREAFVVIEDGQPRPPDAVVEQALPAQIVVAVNSGPALDVRDGQGISRFQRLAQVLDGWAQTLPSEAADDLSLVSISGPVINHASPADFRNSLRAFTPDFRNTTPNLQSLSLALDIAAMQTSQAGMKRAILFVTPHMDDPNIAAAMQPLIDRAVQGRIRVFVWFVDLESYFLTTSAASFNTLAIQTGGSLFAFSGTQSFPNPEAYFAPLRRTYTLSYTSTLTGGGRHSLVLEVGLGMARLRSPEQVFDLDLQPPNPILVAPPLQITRQAPTEDPFNTERLVPEEQQIGIVIEFPDRHPRPLLRTTFYVDGQIADENTSEPFDSFTWNLTGYTVSGEHQILVEAVDSLGLSRTTIAIPVTLTIIQPPRGIAAVLARYRMPVIIGAVVLAGLALAFILLTGRVRIPTPKTRRAKREQYRDPLTQPVPVAAEPKTSPAERAKLKKEAAAAKRMRLVDAPASLVRLLPDGQPATDHPIPLVEKELVFGTDPVNCNHILDDASISPVHARLKQTGEGRFILSDNGSVSGTWVNYEPVTREGRRLEAGDVVHLGRLIFQFRLRNAPPARTPKVTPEKPMK